MKQFLFGALYLMIVVFIAGMAITKIPAEAQIGDNSALQTPDGSVIFVENAGQFDPSVRFRAQSNEGTFWVGEDVFWFTLTGQDDDGSGEKRGTGVNLAIRFGESNQETKIQPFGPIDTTLTYGGPSGGFSDVQAWTGLHFIDLYPGLDLIVFGTGGRWGWQLMASGPAQTDEVNLIIEGAEDLNIEGSSIVMSTILGDYPLPSLFPINDPMPGVVKASRVILPVPDSLPLVSSLNGSGGQQSQLTIVNPPYSTFIGQSAWEEGRAIVVDDTGSAYVTGYTESLIFPREPGEFTPEHGIDVYVVKLNPLGTALEYALWMNTTTLNAEDYGNGIAIDSLGHAFVTGYTFSTDYCAFLGTVPGYDTTYNGNGDAYIMKVNQSGSGLDFCTYFGGNDLDLANDIALDANGDIYITGSTWSMDDFPISPDAYDASHNGLRDVFVAKLNGLGTSLNYSTFLGGSGQEEATAIALDTAGNAFITGWVISSDFDTTPGAFDPDHNGGTWDGFVSKFNNDGSALVYSTYFGGAEEDRGTAIGLASGDRAIITGLTRSEDFPTTPGAYDESFAGGDCGVESCGDSFVIKFNPAGNGLTFSTYLGGSDDDGASGLYVDAEGRPFVCGGTFSTDFPTTDSTYDALPNGGKDAFVSGFTEDGSGLQFSTYLGGSEDDSALDLWLDESGRPYVTGRTQSPNFPVTPDSYDITHNGDNDIFVNNPVNNPINTATLFLPAVMGQ